MSKLNGSLSPDQSTYATSTDGAGALLSLTTVQSGAAQPSSGNRAPDGSKYMTLTDGNGSLV